MKYVDGKMVNDDGSPIRPGFETYINPNTGFIHGNYEADFNPDTQALNEIQKRALSTGPSAWQTQALAQQGLEEQGQRQNLQQQGASSEAGARAALASKYGLSPAAQQRLALQNQKSQMSGLQNIGFQGSQARGNIGLQDEQMKNQFLNELPGMQNQLAQGQTAAREYNVTNTLNEKNLQNAANLSAYGDQMRAWASGKQADAQANAGGGGKK